MTTHAQESRATYAARDDGPGERAWDGIPARIFLQPIATTAGTILLPLGTYSRTANVPGRSPTTPIELEYGEPGVKKGQ